MLVPLERPELKITVQGGVGTSKEHQLLLDYYRLDNVDWGTPFLLVPKATMADARTLEQLKQAKECELYFNGISPQGVPFNSLHQNTKDEEKEDLVKKGRPGSSCPKKF